MKESRILYLPAVNPWLLLAGYKQLTYCTNSFTLTNPSAKTSMRSLTSSHTAQSTQSSSVPCSQSVNWSLCLCDLIDRHDQPPSSVCLRTASSHREDESQWQPEVLSRVWGQISHTRTPRGCTLKTLANEWCILAPRFCML